LEKCCLKGYRRFVPDTELEVSGSKDTILEERDRAGHGPQKGGSAIEDEEEEEEEEISCGPKQLYHCHK
jgi:hypothetical protein